MRSEPNEPLSISLSAMAVILFGHRASLVTGKRNCEHVL